MEHGVTATCLANPWLHCCRQLSGVGNAFSQTRLGQAYLPPNWH